MSSEITPFNSLDHIPLTQLTLKVMEGRRQTYSRAELLNDVRSFCSAVPRAMKIIKIDNRLKQCASFAALV